MDYSLLKRTELGPDQLGALPSWDVFLSAYNSSERTKRVFEAVTARRKEWLVHPDYEFSREDLPVAETVHRLESRDEAEFWREYFGHGVLADVGRDASICVDISGFMRPHLMLFPKLLRAEGFKRLDVVYSSPVAYLFDEATRFTKGAVTDVRQVRGFEGTHSPDGGEKDLLIIGSGYEDELIRQVAEDKGRAKKMQLFGLPGLQPHMYEESRLCATKAAESMGGLPNQSSLFGPANDPFMTAQVLHDVVAQRRQSVANLYLSPLASKAQALGFSLYYLCECVGASVSIIFPYTEYYSRKTSVGLGATVVVSTRARLVQQMSCGKYGNFLTLGLTKSGATQRSLLPS